MSQFYDLASLVVIPSGYKASTIYAQKPLTTDGQLSFTRASGATRVASNGLIEKVRENQYYKSTALITSTLYVPYGVTPTSLGTYPVYADSLAYSVATSVSNQGAAINLLSSSSIRVASFFAKDLGALGVETFYYGGTSAFIAGYATTEIINGYTRYYVPIPASTNGLLYIRPNNNGGGTFFLTAPQIENGDYPTAYISNNTTASVVSVGPVSNVPRLDYLGSSCPRLLLEPQRTNLATYSEQFDNAVWSKNSLTINANSAVSPDGYNNADKLQDSTNTLTNHLISSGALATAGITYTWSAFMKKAEYNYGHLHAYDKAGAIFDLNAGAVISTDGIGATITNYGNGWFLCTYTFVALNTGVFINPSKTSTSAYSYTGTIGSGIYAWGAQLEAGVYATSYIPTLGASVTRVADAASKTGISSLIGQTEGTIFGEAFFQSGQENLPMWVRNSSGGLYGDYILMYTSPSGFPAAQCQVGGVNQVNIVGGSPISTGWHKYAFAYKQNDFAFYVDGVFIGSDSSGSVPTCNEVYIDQYIDGAIRNTSKRQALVFKTRLTNAQLAELTTL